ncbi:MAG: Trm112 family protein [Anaerolineales bacterium]
MLSEDLLAILACPACKTRVELVADKWLVCQNPECRRKYPIKDGIPIMLIEEGDKYVDVAVEDLEEMEP